MPTISAKFSAKSALVKLLAFAVSVQLFPAIPAHGDLALDPLAAVERLIETTSLVAQTPSARGTRRIRVTVTAYSPTPEETDETPCITASGLNVCANPSRNVVAANFLPLGAKVKIPELFGDRVFTVEDRMNARYNGRHWVDVLVRSRSAAKAFGKNHDVEVVIF